jgi:restriction endonuclease S subunit
MLVENYLYAVVSLPAGVFQPYSGVKTSILLMDKMLSKKTDSILFVKIENDGFDLGAQRRPIDRNDLPDALQVIREYIEKVRNGKADAFHADEKPCSALLVKKEKLAENGEYNLTGDRYRVVESKHQKWPMVRLGEVLELSGKDRVGEEELPIMSITMYRGLIDQDEKFKKRIASKNIENYKKVYKDELVVGFPIDEGVLGFQTKYKVAAVSPAYDIWKLKKQDNIFIPYLEIIFRSKQAREIYKSRMRGTVSRRRDIPASDFLEIQIPLPPLEVQQEIVAEIESYQKIIDGCRQVIDAWKPDVETYLDEELKTYLATDQNNLVYDKLKEALEKFRMQDFYLIETDSNERAITAKIVCYLQEQFQSWNVDHEFNRNQEDIKRDNQGNRIIPDIIIHKRGTNDNLVMIEVKKHIFSNEYKERLRNNAKDLGYKYAFAITIDKNKPVEKWIEPLIEEKAKKDLLTSWPMVKLREVCEIIGGGTPSREKSEYWNGTIPWISSKHFNEDNRIVSNEYITESGLNNSSSKIAPKGSTILITRVSVGKYAIADKDYAINQDLTAIKPIIKNLDESFLFLTSSKLANEIKSNAVGLGVKGVTRDFVSNLQIPLPPLEVQIHIVDKIESERKIIDSLREMVKTYEEKIKRVIDSVWGE